MPSKEEAEEWKKQLVDNAEQQILNLTDSDKFKNYLNTVAKFHRYSARNIDLIYSQNPDATQIAGFKQWKNDFNRSVNKGEKSIRISAPIIKKLTPEEKQRFNTTEERAIVGYRYIPVFDITQTHGAPVPNVNDFVKENLSDHKNVSNLYNELKDYLNKNTDLKVSEQNLDAQKGVKGYFQPATNEIVIADSEPDSALKLKTLYHEYAHSQLHGLTSAFRDRPREYKETQAEAVAYIAMQNIGVDTSDYSLGYVATWAQNKDIIHEALSEIQKISNKVVDLSNSLTEKLGLQAHLNQNDTLDYDENRQSFSGIVQGNEISLSENEYFSDLTNIYNVKDLSNDELKAITVNLLKQAKATYQEMSKLSGDDNDLYFWADDYKNEKANYINLQNELSKRNIIIPENLKYADEPEKMDKAKKDLVTTIKLSTEKNIELPVNNISNDKESNDPEHPTLDQQYKKLLKQLNEPESNSKQTAKQLKQVRQDISQQTQSELQEFAKNTPTLSKNKPDHEEPSL